MEGRAGSFPVPVLGTGSQSVGRVWPGGRGRGGRQGMGVG